MAKRASPGVGRNVGIGDNSGLASHDAIRDALAIDLLFEEQKAELNERHKRAKKGFEQHGVTIEGLKFLKKLKDEPASEIERLFRSMWHYIGSIFEPLHEQFDLLAPKTSTGERRAAHFTMGLLAGLQGKELNIPPAVVGDDRNEMTKGWNEGQERRAKANENILAMAVDPKNNGMPVDGTADAVATQAAKDFAADHGDNPLIVGGVEYPNMRQANAARKRLAETPAEAPAEGEQAEGEQPAAEGEETDKVDVPPFMPAAEAASAAEVEAAPAPVERVSVPRPDFTKFDDDPDEWFAAQKAEFQRWFDSLSADHVPDITHPGAVAMFRKLRAEQDAAFAAAPGIRSNPEDRRAPGEEDQVEEAPPLPGPQTADLPDEDEVKAAADRLAADPNFVPPAKRRGRPPKVS